MAIATLKKEMAKLRKEIEQKSASLRAETTGILARLRDDPTRIMTECGRIPDQWQREVLTCSDRRMLLLCSRQVGKTEAIAALALKTALLSPSLVLLLSPSERQSGELAQRVFAFYDALGQPVPTRKRTELQLHLANGSRILALPDNEKTVRVYAGVSLIVVDEASRVPDDLYRAVRPMLAVSNGRLVCLSTPFGQRGFFFEAWEGAAGTWRRFKVTAEECPRISREFLENERRTIGERWFRQEFLCSFEEAVGAVFSYADIQATRSDAVEPWDDLIFGSGS